MLRLSVPLSIVRIPHHTPGRPRGLPAVIVAEAAERSGAVPRRTRSALETRISLVLALASQASALSLRVLGDLASESAKYAFPRRFEARNLEEALMAVPDLETVRFRVVKRAEQYEIREVEPYYVAETCMSSKSGFDFNGASRAFNVLAAYLFGKNSGSQKMEMTAPVYTQKIPSKREKMDMTTPVITKQSSDEWHMSFVLPSKYGATLPLPEDPFVRIRQVPGRTMAVSAFSGFVTDENVKMRESKLRIALISHSDFQIKEDATIEVAQFNPPFTLPFTRRNEISLEVQRKMI